MQASGAELSIRPGGGRLDHGPDARVLELPEPERNRISLGRLSHLIHRRFEGEDIAVDPEVRSAGVRIGMSLIRCRMIF